ncbi:outer membrane beta-barrel protein [Caulobacter sp. SLTY]|uniref:porin family protein n=1 Tax=Caulobacter sp. SLTY TaxID=2683262 RepID=UPI001412E073|nr:porin family protein [Caulobacter sp. SLTY]NBB15897.1 outer membrane beta-barrel protein [Caulobacter sp. SLTY]
MKSLMIAAASVAAIGFAAPAMAQDMTPSGYGTIGGAFINAEGADLGAVQGRVGARFGQYLGVEGELSAGVSDDSTSFAGTRANVDLNYQAGVYAVGYLPVTPKADIFARVGYSKSEFDVSIPGLSGSGDVDGVAYGIGGQYFFTEKDGIRVDVTRHDSDDGDADVVGIGYVRKF